MYRDVNPVPTSPLTDDDKAIAPSEPVNLMFQLLMCCMNIVDVTGVRNIWM